MGELRSAVDALVAIDLDGLDNTALGELLAEVSRQRDRLDGLCHRLVAEHDRRLAWKADGARSEKEWLRDRCRLSSGEAAVRTNTARTCRRYRQPRRRWLMGRSAQGRRVWLRRRCGICPPRRGPG
jgi:hypothetical protein